jgi:ribose/xylose/arabinose/galactoside ABC-type transport system permease subunit
MTLAHAASASRKAARLRFARENGTLIVLILFCVLASIASGGMFLRPSNIGTILYQASIIGVLALGQMMVIIAGGIDLSVVTILILSATVMGGAGSERQATMMLSGTLPFIGFWPALLAGFGVAAGAGLVNGLVITRLHIPAFITTLSSALLMSGIVLILTGGTPIYYPDPFYAAFGQQTLFGIAAPTYIPVVLALLCAWILSRTAFGKKLYAVGSSERAALHSGISAGRVRLAVYTLSGVFAGIAGFMFLSRTGSISYTSGETLLLTCLAAVVVGGIALRGGNGGVKHAASGVLLLAALSNFMNIMVISPHVQDVVNGAVILVAVSIYGFLQPEQT